MRTVVVTFVLALALLAGVPFASAQENIIIDIDKAEFHWTWAQGDGGVAEYFKLDCGSQIHTILDPAARSVAVRTVVGAPGAYTCVVRAGNAFGESADSPSVTFQAGSVPSAPSSLGIRTN